MKTSKLIILLYLFAIILTGCSMTKMAANQTTSILVQALPAYERETNVEFAEQAIASNLKLLEALLEVAPDNSELLLLASRSFTMYTFGFIEDKIEIADNQNNIEEKNELIAQAVDFYNRAYSYSLRLLAQSRKTFPKVLDQNLDQLSLELKHFKKKHVPALFWTAYAWGNIVNLKQTDPAYLASLPKVELIMHRVLELDENYYFGGPHLFYGVYYGSRPKMLGGDPTKAHEHLRRAIEISNGTFLITKLLLAKYYAVPTQDRELFEHTLNEIISVPPDLFSEQGLANQLARRKAERMLSRIDELFL